MPDGRSKLLPKVGASVGDISPRATTALAGRGGPPRMAPPLEKSLEVNAVVLDDGNLMAALVAVDTLFCSRALLDRVSECLLPKTRSRLGKALFLVASHTHHAPSLDPSKPLLGAVDKTYFEQTAKTIASTIESAVANRTTFKNMPRGNAACAANARRRLKAIRILKRAPFIERTIFTLPNHAPDVPRDLVLYIAHDFSGTPVFTLWSWPCHPTAFPHPNVVDGDFPGKVRQLLRQQLDAADLPVVFFPGFSGDLRADASPYPVPLWKRLMTPFARPFAEVTITNFNLLCDLVGETCKKAIVNAAPIPEKKWTMSHSTINLRLRDFMPDTTHNGQIDLSHLQFGSLGIFMIGTEMCSTWTPILVPLLPPGTILTGYCNDVPCYLPTDSQVLEGGYEVKGFRHSFGVDGTFASDLKHRVTSALSKLSV